MIRRKKWKKWHVEERKSRKKDKRRETKCVRRVGTAFCAARTKKKKKKKKKKNGQLHYNSVIILLSCCILNVFIIPLAYLTGIIIHCIRITQQWGKLCHEKVRLKTFTFFNVIMNCLENFYVIFINYSAVAKQRTSTEIGQMSEITWKSSCLCPW